MLKQQWSIPLIRNGKIWLQMPSQANFQFLEKRMGEAITAKAIERVIWMLSTLVAEKGQPTSYRP